MRESGGNLKITYKDKKIEEVCTDYAKAKRQHGAAMAGKIHQRIKEIHNTDTVETMVQYGIGRCHLLRGDRKGKYAVDLIHPYRLIFEKHGEEIQIAHIMEIVDYH